MVNADNSVFCVGIDSAWEEQGYLYICTELCEKGNLNDYLMELMQTKRKKSSRRRQEGEPLGEIMQFCTEESENEESSENMNDVTPSFVNQPSFSASFASS